MVRTTDTLAISLAALAAREPAFARVLETVWPHSEDIELRTVDVHIRRLRLALGEPDIVRTVRSAGYALDAEGLA